MNVRDLVFPVLIMTDQTLEVCDVPEELMNISYLGLKRKSYLNNTIVDSNGNFYTSMEITSAIRKTPLWKFWNTNPWYEIELNLTYEAPLSIEIFKAKALSIIESEAEFWERQIYQNKLLSKLEKAQTISEIVGTISEVK